MTYKIMIVLLLFCFLINSCSKNKTVGNEKGHEESNSTELNVEINEQSGNNPLETMNSSTIESNSTIEVLETNTPVPLKTSGQEKSNFFLSGRTEFLSIKNHSTISAEDFELGFLYEERTASEEIISIVNKSKLFFDSLIVNNVSYNSIYPSWLSEIKDYLNHFVLGKISIERIVYGIPQMALKKAEMKIRLKPTNKLAYVYFLKDDEGTWFISGLELDLRKDQIRLTEEKWFPSVTPSPFTY